MSSCVGDALAAAEPVQHPEPRGFSLALLRAPWAGAPHHPLLPGPDAQGGAAFQHDRQILQVQLRALDPLQDDYLNMPPPHPKPSLFPILSIRRSTPPLTLRTTHHQQLCSHTDLPAQVLGEKSAWRFVPNSQILILKVVFYYSCRVL